MVNDTGELQKSIDRLDRSIKRMNSLGWSFLKGIAAAAGGTIGLAIVVTTAVYIIAAIPETNAIGAFFHAVAGLISRNQH
ncbi:MAG TPA: hypothetical protein VGM19_04810 [Armatimonadota bacterium]|jgi:hypothetical protein